MLGKFATWFIVFGLSFLVSDVLGRAEQGKAFLYIHLGVVVVFILGLVMVLLIAGLATRNAALANGISFLLILTLVVTLVVILFATWGATKLFGVDFYITYQIMTFGQCLCISDRKKEEN